MHCYLKLPRFIAMVLHVFSLPPRKEVMHLSLSVCLLAGLFKKLSTNFDVECVISIKLLDFVGDRDQYADLGIFKRIFTIAGQGQL